jgi:hypothetical protein
MMADANAEEPFKPAAFNLPDGTRSETVAYPSRPLHILLATTGSVASIKAPLIAEALLKVRLLQLYSSNRLLKVWCDGHEGWYR